MPTTEWLTIEQVLFIHKRVVDETGGLHGLRSLPLLDAALARPQATVFGEDAYPTLHDKAAALLHSLALNHAFTDGNKRVAAVTAGMFLARNGWRLTATNDELATFVMQVAQGGVAWQPIADWLRAHTVAVAGQA